MLVFSLAFYLELYTITMVEEDFLVEVELELGTEGWPRSSK